ncbi:hypothetical protein BJ741DRAFT_585632 [Chytriomyces cf. hyalinus JEL632]|nr:hypothetical protein BJ741DRAFT_585632 [Chytriomyces cf. hyalinus JEL632]
MHNFNTMASPATVDDISDATLAYLFDRRHSAIQTTKPSFDRRMSLPTASFMLEPAQTTDYDAFSLTSDTASAPSTPLMVGLFNQPALCYNPKLFSTLPELLLFPLDSYSENRFTNYDLTFPTASSDAFTSESLSLPTFEATSAKSPNSPNSPNYGTQPATTLYNDTKLSHQPAEPTAKPTAIKPGKFRPTESQLAMLASLFEKNPFPSATLRTSLADAMGVQPKQIRFWFQNRRATYKINGIHVLKPNAVVGRKHGAVASIAGGVKEEELDLELVSNENPFFYVEKGRRHSVSVVCE